MEARHRIRSGTQAIPRDGRVFGIAVWSLCREGRHRRTEGTFRNHASRGSGKCGAWTHGVLPRQSSRARLLRTRSARAEDAARASRCKQRPAHHCAEAGVQAAVRNHRGRLSGGVEQQSAARLKDRHVQDAERREVHRDIRDPRLPHHHPEHEQQQAVEGRRCDQRISGQSSPRRVQRIEDSRSEVERRKGDIERNRSRLQRKRMLVRHSEIRSRKSRQDIPSFDRRTQARTDHAGVSRPIQDSTRRLHRKESRGIRWPIFAMGGEPTAPASGNVGGAGKRRSHHARAGGNADHGTGLGRQAGNRVGRQGHVSGQ